MLLEPGVMDNYGSVAYTLQLYNSVGEHNSFFKYALHGSLSCV